MEPPLNQVGSHPYLTLYAQCQIDVRGGGGQGSRANNRQFPLTMFLMRSNNNNYAILVFDSSDYSKWLPRGFVYLRIGTGMAHQT